MDENRMEEQINQLLQNLRITSKRTFEDENFRGRIADVLNGVGFHAMNDDRETILNVFRRAVDSSVCAGKNINLAANENTIPNFEDTKVRLEQMLLTGRTGNANIADNLDDVLCRPLTQELASHDQLKSPQNIADKNFVGIKQDTHVDFVTNLIEKQFSIEWNTGGGNLAKEPDEFNFYKFCDVEKLKENEEQRLQDVPMEVKTKHLKYNPRRAHVMVQLYRFCKTRQRIKYTKKQLCPPVYIRTANGWKKWVPSKNNLRGDNPTSVDPVANTDTEFNWMNGLIKNYIVSSAIRIEEGQLPQILLASTRTRPTRPTLYWAVVDDKDYESGEHLQLNDIGRTQVYVGKAEPGINKRWLTAGSSHCKMMKKCLDNVQAMTTYDPLRLEGIQLVDARLLLAKLRKDREDREDRKEKCALFVMKTYEKTEEGTENLKRDEKFHINGVSSVNEPILPTRPDWKPMSMAYGMNSKVSLPNEEQNP